MRGTAIIAAAARRRKDEVPEEEEEAFDLAGMTAPVEEDDGGNDKLFVVFGRDHDSLEDVRFSLHPAHVQYLRDQPRGIYEAGYFLHDHLQAAAGSLYVVGAATAQQAMATAAADPFTEAGLFSELYVNEWHRLLEPEFDNYLTSPPFLLYSRDKEDAGALRAQTRPAHLKWLREHADRIVAVGPLGNPDPLAAAEGQPMCGSLVIACGESLEEVRAWAASDPYAEAGLFQDVVCAPFTSLDVITRALPNAPGPPVEDWWSPEEMAEAPDLLVSRQVLDESDGLFTEDGALRTPEQELRDAASDEDSAEVERWAEAIERQRLGTDGRIDTSPLVSVDAEDGDDLDGLFWRETDEDTVSDWPFQVEASEEELKEASERIKTADDDDDTGIDLDITDPGMGEDGLVLDGSQQDNSLQQMS